MAAELSLREYASTLLRRIAVLAGILLATIWAMDGQGYFWPAWVWLGLAVPPTLDVTARWAWRHEKGPSRRVACVWAVTLVAIGILIFTWVITRLLDGVSEFWPAWALLALASACGGYSVLALHDRVLVARGKRALKARVELLSRTRREAVDAAAAELRRIERDLHDGAQARLVALSLKLGRAELKLEDRPDVRALISEAQREAHSAIAELRDLARGIVPPLLADRGLLAAIHALAARYGLDTAIDADIRRRLAPAVEGAAYFVIAEALTNTVKHAAARHTWVTIATERHELRVVVGDAGRGGADPNGSGLAGLRARVQALDGMLAVQSRPGAGTLVKVSLPAAGERHSGDAAGGAGSRPAGRRGVRLRARPAELRR